MIVIVIMVKDEELKIIETIKPYVESGYKNFVIYDTGSTDGTVDKITEFLKKSAVIFNLKIDKFIPNEEHKYFPFSIYRNKTLDYTRSLYKNSLLKYMLFIDCEWYIVGAKELLEFVEKNTNPTDSFNIDIHEGNQIHSQKRLLKINGKSLFSGVIHETVNDPGDDSVPHNIYFNMIQSNYGNAKTKLRNKGDVIVLNNLYETTKDPRWLFYLGQTYENLWNNEKAIESYERRIELDGDIREKYVACCRLAGYYAKTNWDKAMSTYLRAYQIYPSRIECLVKIAQHYHGSDAHMKYMFAKQACMVDYKPDGCFVDEKIYIFDRWEQLSIAAWDMCYFNNCNNKNEVLNEGYKAALIAREKGGEVPYLIRNVSLFENALGITTPKLSVKSSVEESNIINLILYSEDEPCYISMRKLLSSYLKSIGIEHYFYCFRNNQDKDFILEDDILYIKGTETYIPGIMNKTLHALEYLSNKEFKYIVRTNISSFVNFELLSKLLKNDNFDYGGCIRYGFNQIGINNDDIFIGGQCLILSKSFVKCLVLNKDLIKSYNRIDDHCIGLFYIRKCKDKMVRHLYSEEYYAWNTNDFNSSKFLYRNRQNDIRNNNGSIEDKERINDVNNMCNLIIKCKKYYNNDLEILYKSACDTRSDINEHVPIHYELAKECNSVIEIGVRDMVSTWGLLKGLSENVGSKYVGIDLFRPPEHNMINAEKVCKTHGIDFNFIVQDDLKVDTDKIGMVDMIFLDALHQYGQVTQELEKYSPLARKYFTFHDTSDPWGNADEPLYGVEPFVLPDWVDKTKRGVWPAVQDFLIRHPEWSLKERKFNNHGFTILERKNINENIRSKFIDYESKSTELCHIGAKYDTDKSSQRKNPNSYRHCHPYTLFYDSLFNIIKDDSLKIAEIGIYKGSSILMWQDYFKNSIIDGYEYDKSMIEEFNNNFSRERINIHEINIKDKNSINKSLGDKLYDIIIEDSTHEFDDQVRFIKNAFKNLKCGGTMVIEDIFISENEKRYYDELKPILHLFEDIYFVTLDHKNKISTGWNNDKLLVIVKKQNEISVDRKIIDCFTFYNELEMLKYRLETLDNIVDYFVLIEATKTYKGNDKKLYYNENKHLYEKYNDKIIHIIVDDMPAGDEYNNVWRRERHQRRCITRGIDKLKLLNSDIIIISDLDEIPNPLTLGKIKEDGLTEVKNLNQDMYYYNLTCKEEAPWKMAKICNYGSYYNPDEMRLHQFPESILNGGWHLSYFGNTDFIINKLNEFSHQEFNNDFIKNPKRIEECIRKSEGLFPNIGSNYKYIALSDNNNLPPNHEFFFKRRICKHIAFFYNHERLKYVNKMIDEVNNYEDETDIFIHTNVEIDINLFNKNNNGKLEIVVHDLTGKNPFYLTWKCRNLMKDQLNDYTTFIYVEDDILIPSATISYWKEFNEKCICENSNLGFLRIEFDSEGIEYLTDITEKFSKYTIIDNKPYVINDINPYCAFWIYNKNEFKRFVESELYDPANITGYDIREKSAIGLNGLLTKWYTQTIIPFTNLKIDYRCKVYHMPNNYVKSGNSWGTGEIPFDDCTC